MKKGQGKQANRRVYSRGRREARARRRGRIARNGGKNTSECRCPMRPPAIAFFFSLLVQRRKGDRERAQCSRGHTNMTRSGAPDEWGRWRPKDKRETACGGRESRARGMGAAGCTATRKEAGSTERKPDACTLTAVSHLSVVHSHFRPSSSVAARPAPINPTARQEPSLAPSSSPFLCLLSMGPHPLESLPSSTTMALSPHPPWP